MATEDLTTFTEVDAGGDITLTAAKCDVVTIKKADVSYVSKDYGDGPPHHFDDVDHDFDCCHVAESGNQNRLLCWAICDTPGTVTQLMATNDGVGVEFYAGGAGNRWLFVDAYDNSDAQDAYASATETTYYCTVTRVGTAVTVTIFSDAARTILLDTLAVTSTTTARRYLEVFANRASGSGDYYDSCWSQNFDLNEAAAGGGHPAIKRFGGIPFARQQSQGVQIW